MALFSSRSSKSSKMFQAGKATASINGIPAILIGVSVQIQRSLSPVPTLTDGVVWSAQPVQGTLSAQSILTNGAGKNLLTTMANGDSCKPMNVVVKMNDGACDSSGIILTIKDGFCSGVSLTANGSQGYIGSDFTMNFTQCSV